MRTSAQQLVKAIREVLLKTTTPDDVGARRLQESFAEDRDSGECLTRLDEYANGSDRWTPEQTLQDILCVNHLVVSCNDDEDVMSDLILSVFMYLPSALQVLAGEYENQ